MDVLQVLINGQISITFGREMSNERNEIMRKTALIVNQF